MKHLLVASRLVKLELVSVFERCTYDLQGQHEMFDLLDILR